MIGSGMPIIHSRSPRPIVSLHRGPNVGDERQDRQPVPAVLEITTARSGGSFPAVLMEIKAALQRIGDSHASTNTVERF
jgi:hypothetical protein